MPGGTGDVKDAGTDEKLANLRSVLGSDAPRARLIEILEASNGSLEYAIEIYFHQQQQETKHVQQNNNDPGGQSSPIIISVEDESSESTNVSRGPSSRNEKESDVTKKRSPSELLSPGNSSERTGTKQARLDSFFRATTTSGIGSSPRVKTKDDRASIPNAKKENHEKAVNGCATNDALVKGDGLDPPRTKSFASTATPISLLHTRIESLKNSNVKSANASSVPCFSFRRLCEMLQEMADTTKRLVKLKALETFIREVVSAQVTTDSGCDEIYVSTRANTLSAALELVLGGCTSTPTNVSGSAVSKALQTSLGITRNQISKAYRQYGDLGDCAASFFQKKTHFLVDASARRQLSIVQVTEALQKISETDGTNAKQHILLTLLRDCHSKIECRFLVRLLIRNMRIGANVKTVLAALATAIMPSVINDKGAGSNASSKMDVKDAIMLVQKTHDVCPNISKIVRSLLEGGFDQMKRNCSIQVMTPIAPMLAHPIHSLDEVNERMGDGTEIATMEWKYDGMRCQAHYDGFNVQLFSRHLLDITSQFPDVVKSLLGAIRPKNPREKCSSFVIDAEIVGVEGEGNETRLLPFQDLSTRRKKLDDGKGVQVKVFAFDLMFLNGASFVNEQLSNRQSSLQELFVETSDFCFVSSQELIKYDESKIKSYLLEAIEGGAEGLMVKLMGKKSTSVQDHELITDERLPKVITSLYEAGTRSHSWLKVKRDYVAGFSDTIDVVPIGAWWGSGRKAQKSFLSPVLLAVYDDEEDVYRSVCRCMSFTDAMYECIREFYFNGTAYPVNAESGFIGNTTTKPKVQESYTDQTSDNEENCDNFGHKEDEDHDTDARSKIIHGDEDTKDTGRVHCFSSRPSSAFVVTNESPPIWFKPMEVFEVAFADLSLSRQHTAAAGLVDEEGRGIALRFPRFKRRRPDKKPEHATTSVEIAHLFAKQAKIKTRSQNYVQKR